MVIFTMYPFVQNVSVYKPSVFYYQYVKLKEKTVFSTVLGILLKCKTGDNSIPLQVIFFHCILKPL